MDAVTRFVLLAEPVERGGSDGSKLAAFVDDLSAVFRGRIETPFALRDGRVGGAIDAGASPVDAIVLSQLAAPVPLRWAALATTGPGPGPGEWEAAASALDDARAAGERAVVRTGVAAVDRLVADILPALIDQLGDLTIRQKEVARLALFDGLRQSQVAGRLGIARATTSIAFERAHVRSLARLIAAATTLIAGAERERP